ncbi:hypothetical protein CANTEDRAFT_114377 [Yamadazyma tenuis ATCC 10573]|uniref:Uncharacterized protein n=1 Tax=Candida tenuis (strain ATCC 10573 / BCRC 21748 / CBS 615 / JCM 9827 / NBRC 10315 / NRRL Y-1498 / VKM Y-70) TaxID=590646 RepID=G3B706_CANTC|nr:uncharacterized protein CANTEDRAFT_114377 [Yamadazyma tenuis ATCC 10573]EGV63066.1 hypothetical protein CANTEDRAFT_114377 [Yamadazyma tenuis ATCC 10573]
MSSKSKRTQAPNPPDSSSSESKTGNSNGKKVTKPTGNSLKEREKRKKQVFKPVLDNPFTQIQWPFIEPELGSHVVESLEVLLTPVGQYHKNITAKGAPMPKFLDGFTFGFNPTTEALERQANTKHPDADKQIRYVFVCRYDIIPSILTQHFPVLTYTALRNSHHTIKLIQLPKGAIDRLSQASGINDLSILSVTGNAPGVEGFFDLYNSVPEVQIPFLEPILKKRGNFKSPLIKLISTSAPVGSSSKKKPQK